MTEQANHPQVSQYGSVDPAPPSKLSEVEVLTKRLCDESLPMFQRMPFFVAFLFGRAFVRLRVASYIAIR